MKKVVALLLACLCVFSLASCDKGNKLTMATNAEFPPFESVENGEIVGVDIEIAQEIAKILGRELEITNIDFDGALAGVVSGKYDIAVAGITADAKRRKNMNFSDEYYKASQAIIVLADSEIKGKDDLKGKTISCQEGTTGEQYLNENKKDNNYNVQSFKSGAEAVTALVSKKVDAVVIDNAVAKALSEKQEGKTVVLDEALTQEAYAIALKKGNDELTKQINDALKQLKENGKLEEIFKKYNLKYDA